MERVGGFGFLVVVLDPASDLGRRVTRVGGSSFVVVESGPLAAVDSMLAPAALDFSFGKDAPGRGTIVRPCCSVTDATAEVWVGSGLSIASQL